MTPETTEITTDVNTTNEQHTNNTFTEDPSTPQNTKKHIPLTHRTFVKFLAFVITTAAMLLTAGSIVFAIFIADENMYSIPQETYRKDFFDNQANNNAYNIVWNVIRGYDSRATSYCISNGFRSCVVTDLTNNEILYSFHSSETDSTETLYSFSYDWLHQYGALYPADYLGFKDANKINITIEVADSFNIYNDYYFTDKLISTAYELRHDIYYIAAASFVVMCAGFVFLMCASGRRKGLLEAQPGWGTKIPFDLLSGATALASCAALAIFFELENYHNLLVILIGVVLIAIVLAIMLLGWCMSFAVRIKLGAWWKNTITFYVLKFVWSILIKLWKLTGRAMRGIVAFLRTIPFVWKTSLALAALTVIEFFLILMTAWEPDVLLILWFLEKLVLIPLIIFAVSMLKKLKLAGEAISSGNLEYQVDTRKMFWDFKQHGEHLNRIGEGMTRAVNERVKSEHMKTELITNVSHDIKTPLTSIINYADLIAKEPCDNATITEYSVVLLRQSERLKRLIDDLVEVSKATTGNLEVILAPCEAGVLLTQVAGEYEQKLADCNLELITSQPDVPVKIMADGRRLWRVFDNLMNNICKYAQAGTRVYVTLEKQHNDAVIIFRNTSREPLNIPADELLERFTRGDSSRNTEGNGLGLSIAQSLTELQKGTMFLVTDGDLFKVILHFPIII